MNRPPFVYRSDGRSHWRQAPRRFGASGSRGEHALVALVALIFLPLSLLVMVKVRHLLMPLLAMADRRRGRRE